MAHVNKLSRVFGIEPNNHELCFAQYKGISAQAPLFYLIMISTMFAVSYVSFSHAPAFLSIVMPLVLLVGFLSIFFGYSIPRSISLQEYRKAIVTSLHMSVVATSIFGATFSYWIISIFNYADHDLHYLIIAIVGPAAIGASICLLHLRAASIALSSFTLLPMIVYLWQTGEPAYSIIALISALVVSVFLYVANKYSLDFAEMTMRRIEIEDKKNEAQQLSHSNRTLAELDSLTGLANRRLFMNQLESRVKSALSHDSSNLVVGIMDLDGFKQINDVYGHATGDRLLREAGHRLRELLPAQVFLARLGGDEFGIITNKLIDDDMLFQFGEKICRAMEVPFDLGGFKTRLGVSVGFAKWDEKFRNSETFFEMVDYALYHSKDKRRGGVTIFNQRHADTIRRSSGVARGLQEADFEKEMTLEYQPIVSASGDVTIGFEALARWRNPVLGSVSPDVFIRAAERAGTINRLTAVLLKKALEEARNWPDDLFLSFNLSMQDILCSEAMVTLISIVNKSGFDPRRITFEVTETSIMSDHERAFASLELLKNMGCKIALDDFGTGYSSLAHVRQMPLDKLKLDRKFIAQIETEQNAGAIVHALVDMCKNLQVDCIVEGVETRDQLDILQELGVEFIQGYYYSKPLSGPDALSFVSQNQERAMAG